MRRTARGISIAVLLISAACATGGRGRGDSTGDTLVVTEQLVMETSAHSAYDLVQARRPAWLQKRGPTSFLIEKDVVVYQDDIKMGGPSALRDIDVSIVRAIRHYNAGQAQQRFGTGHPSGAIQVVTRGGA